MKYELHTQQFSGFTHHVSLQLGEVLGDSSSFKIDEQLSCAPLTCSDGSENFLLSPQKNSVHLENCYIQVALPLF